MTDKHYEVKIMDKDGNIKRSTTIFSKDINSVGGIGNLVESIDHFTKDGESIEVGIFYQ